MSLSKKIRWAAIVAVVGYAAIRLFIVKAAFEKFGVNPWVFFIIDAATGVFYILGIEQLVTMLTGKSDAGFKKILLWALVTCASFAAPYVYLYAAGQSMPFIVSVGIGLVILLLLINAVMLFRRRLHPKK